eukprot:scpid106982/ scgid31463/ 
MSSLNCKCCGSSSTILKFVSCLHTLCVPCLRNNIAFDGSIQCPQCFSRTELRFGLEPLCSLPNAVVDGDSVAGDKRQNTPIVCEECGDDTLATSSCDNCHVKLCDAHAGVHPLNKTTKGHVVKPLSQETSGSSAAGSTSRSAATQHRCVLHTSEFVDGFCVQCDQLLCPKCKQTHSHRKDHQVLDIATAGQKNSGYASR